MPDLLSQDVLVISRKAKVIEMTKEYRIMGRAPSRRHHGAESVEGEEGRPNAHRPRPVPHAQERVLTMERPPRHGSKIKIRDGSGTDRGAISQGNIIGKKHFALSSASGEQLGTLDAENWRAGTSRSETRVAPRSARSRRSAGLIKEGFTPAETYVLQVTDPAVSGDLRFRMLAAAASIDIALKQEDTGGWGFGGIA